MHGLSDQAPEISKMTLERIQFQLSQEFGKFTLSQTKATLTEDTIWDSIVYRLRTEILGQHDIQTYNVSVDVPKDWWEHFKFQHLPPWWQHRWPIKWKIETREVTFDHKALWPMVNYLPPGQDLIVMHTEPLSPDVFPN